MAGVPNFNYTPPAVPKFVALKQRPASEGGGFYNPQDPIRNPNPPKGNYSGPNFLQTIISKAKSTTPSTTPTAKTTKTTKTTGGTSAAAPKGFTADMLYQDPMSVYQPVLANLNDQSDAARKRYETNKANITSIFGALTGLSAADTAAINKQFADSIASQQMSLAARTAEQRAATKAGETQAVATGAERGAGPAMSTNPIAVAAEEGIARSNEYQTTWEALQNTMKNQAVIDTQNRQAGYGQQEVGALQSLAQSLEDRLLALSGDKAQVRSDIAQAQLGARQNVLDAKYQEAQRAKSAAASAAAAANKPKSYSRDIAGWSAKLDDTFGAGASNGAIGSVTAAIAEVKAAKKAAAATNSKVSTKVSKSEVIAKLTKDNPSDPAIGSVIEYVNKYSGLSS